MKAIKFKTGDKVSFSIPYFDSKLHYNGIVKSLNSLYAVVEYYQPINSLMLVTHINIDDLQYTEK
jgi:hypothetical protein